jgi:SAM-dependent methyltransferase
MSDETASLDDRARDARDGKEQDRRLWASGAYSRIAQLVEPMGCDLVDVAAVGPGMRVLDVATGTGNVAIPAALAGAEVTALDLTASLLAVGRSRAAAAGVQVEWIEGDAEDLPFPTGSFDLVLSAIGAIFAPDHARTAAELVRVCRPGGTIALANWTPDGYGGAFFGLLVRHVPSSPAGTEASVPPTAWGDPGYLRELFGDRVEDLTCRGRTLNLDFTGAPEELFELYRTFFGPVLATRAALAAAPARLAAFDHDLVEFVRNENLEAGTPGQGRYQFEYLVVTAVRP